MFEQFGIQFIDLFSGIGGFHQAMNRLSENHNEIEIDFVVASEIDKYAINTYDKNYLNRKKNATSANDVTEFVNSKTGELDERLKDFNFMCAGFPCQAFSKAGNREGFEDQTKGTLFFNLQDILQHRVDVNNPVKFILLENVSNLVTHDKGNTWNVIKTVLTKLGYVLTDDPLHLSPHQFGVPQLRNRIFIPGIHKSVFKENNTEVPKYLDMQILDKNNDIINRKAPKNVTKLFESNIVSEELTFEEVEKYKVDGLQEQVINFWNEFMGITTNGLYNRTIGFPIWLEYFKHIDNSELTLYPAWKRSIIERNVKLFNENKKAYTKFFKKNKELLNIMTATHKKFEWQAGEDINHINQGILQFRPSGLRVKRPTEAPALVAIVHVPIIYDNTNNIYRKLMPREMARLQSFPESFELDCIDQQAYKQLGNSVNVEVVYQILESMNRIKI